MSGVSTLALYIKKVLDDIDTSPGSPFSPFLSLKENLNTGLHAATSGGYGTVVAMPNTNPVVSSFDTAMKIEREAVFGLRSV